MIKEIYFDPKDLISIEVFSKKETSYKWLPRKQKTWLFGLIKRKACHEEGYYEYGCYEECYESGCWDGVAYTKGSLERQGYIVDENKKVWVKPYVKISLSNGSEYKQNFDTAEQASAWVERLREENTEALKNKITIRL